MRSLENGIGAIQTEEEETASKRESKGWMQALLMVRRDHSADAVSL